MHSYHLTRKKIAQYFSFISGVEGGWEDNMMCRVGILCSNVCKPNLSEDLYGVDSPVTGLVTQFQGLLERIRRVVRQLLCMQLKLTMSEVVKSTYFESNGDIWKVDDSGPTTGDTGTERHERSRPPSLKLAALVQFPPAAVEIVLKIALN